MRVSGLILSTYLSVSTVTYTYYPTGIMHAIVGQVHTMVATYYVCHSDMNYVV